jgi:fatty-acyl-CoA synthase
VGELLLVGPYALTAEVLHDGIPAIWQIVMQRGYSCIVGCKKDLFISGGENISLAEIEEVILTHPGVLEVAVIPRPDSSSLCALAAGEDKLARYTLPHAVRFATALPRNAMGKVIKAHLIAEEESQDLLPN